MRKRNNIFAQDWYAWALLACMLIGTLLLFLQGNAGMQDALSRDLCFALGIVLLGIGFIGAHVEFGRVLGHLGATQTLVYGITSSCIGALIYLLVSLLPILARWVATALFLCLTIFFLCRARAAFDPRELFGTKRDEPLRVPCKFMTTSLLQGLSFGFLYGVLSFTGGSLHPQLEIAAFIGSALLTFVTLLVLRVDFNRAIYQIGFPLMAAGMLLSGVFFTSLGSGGFGHLAQMLGFLYLDLVLWALGSYLIRDRNQPATWVAACPSALLMAGRALGLLAGNAVPRDAAGTALSVVAFLIALSALWLSSGKNIRTGWGFIRPGGPEVGGELLNACTSIAQDYGLTPRESDVLKALALGQGSEEIAKSLFISQNTAKSHMQSIYHKIGVHSKKELHRIVTGRQRLFASSQGD
ncbi:MAG: helix-turn-helix transcriptional regulator [Coriobacteriales bacterium]|nr:helix-turn-helix transcriptional regulator [Coriobacteriales bacterium]